MKYFIVVSLACLATALALPAVTEEKGGGAHGGGHHTDVSGGSHHSGYQSASSGQKVEEEFNKDKNITLTISEHESGQVSSGQGTHESRGHSGGSHGSLHSGGEEFGTGEHGSSRVYRSSY